MVDCYNGFCWTNNPPDVQLAQQVWGFVGILVILLMRILIGVVASIVFGAIYNIAREIRANKNRSSNHKMNPPKIDKDAERGIFLALIVSLVYYALFSGTVDAGVLRGDPLAYGVIWTMMNPIHNNRLIWGLTTLGIYFFMLWVQFGFVKAGKLSKWIVYFNLITVNLFMMIGVERSVTVLMFAPLVSMNPLWLIPMILQKFGFNQEMWDQLSYGKIGIPGQPGIFEWQYVVLLIWFIFPTILWVVKRLRK